MSTSHKRQWGFTLVEVLLSMALVSIICGVGVVVYYTVAVRNDLDIAANSTTQILRRAQALAAATGNDAPGWGVYVQPGSVTLFQGATYASRNQTYDVVNNFSTAVTLGGLNEVDFVKFTGAPTSTGSMTFSGSNTTRTVTVNAKGMVSLQ